MKTINYILFIALMCNVFSCDAQRKKKITDNTFQIFLDKFKTADLPLNHKKNNFLCIEATQKEAILFLQKKESDLLTIRTVLGESEKGNEVIDNEKEENFPCCDFKYQLNDSILILCTREGVYGGEKDTTLIFLNSFTMLGKLIDRCVVGGSIYYYESPIFENNSDFILFDKSAIRVFYYDKNYSKKGVGLFTTFYYVNYEITSKGKFIKKSMSDITYLNQHADFYYKYNPKSDDPMNKY